MFFGTPHCGADQDQWKLVAKQFSAVAGISGKGKAAALVNAIVRDSEDLSEIEEDFRQHTGKYKLVSFFETLAWPGTTAPIVDQTSARMMVEHFAAPADGNHLTMCHFEDTNDPTFVQVCQLIEEVTGVPRSVPRPTDDEDESMSGPEEAPVTRPSTKAIEFRPRDIVEEVPWSTSGMEENEIHVKAPARIEKARIVTTTTAMDPEVEQKKQQARSGWFRRCLGRVGGQR